ncbi:MAG: hypothetical protein A49_22390 [Methyloceanibacter sp.]|nr:MAG: hypothetical protein A49_22390 [Methyloceanibacter sp.]
MPCAATFFGAGLVYGAFSIAFQIPNLFRRLFGEGALSAASIPIFATVLTRDGRDSATLFASRLLTLLVVVLAGIALIGEVVLVVLRVTLPDSERTRLTLLLTAIMAPYVIIVCTIAVMGGLLNVLHSFALPTVAPIVLNVSMIIATVVGTTVWRHNDQAAITLLAGSVMLGGVLQLVMQLRGLRSRGLPVRVELTTRDANVRRVLRTMGPMTLGLAAVQVNTLADTLIAAACVPNPGAPAILFYAQRMYQFPLGVFAIAYAVVLFPTLSARAAADEMGAFRRTLAGGSTW